MKKIFLLTACLITCLGLYAQDTKVAIKSAEASSYQTGNEAANAIDGDPATIWHTNWSATPKFPVTFTIELNAESKVDYVRYISRQDGNINGIWTEVTVKYCTNSDANFKEIGTYTLSGAKGSHDLYFAEGVTCNKIQFVIQPGSHDKDGEFASAAEIEAYAYNADKLAAFDACFGGDVYDKLKVASSEGIADTDVKALVDNMLAGADAYKKFRVGEYEAYMTTATLQSMLKTNAQYNNYENPTGIYLKKDEKCIVAVSGIGNYPVKLKIKDWYKSGDVSTYSLHNGLNYITATTEGNLFVDYYTDDFKNAPKVKMHFINAPVLGYWDQATMKNADWENMLKGTLAADDVILIARSEHAQVAYPIGQWKQHCPSDIETTMTLYQQVQWAQRDILGLEKFDRQVKNRQLFYADKSGSMYAGGDAGVCGYNDLKAIIVPNAAEFDFWGIGHEWGHNNQIQGFHWSGCGETTNNIYASWGQFHAQLEYNGKPYNLRLEDEVTGVGEYAKMRGGRMQVYFEEGLRKGIAWQLQDGPDYHKATPATTLVDEYDADGKKTGNKVPSNSRNYDHFVKLAPFWQLNLWGTLAGKCPDIIPMVIESIRTTENYTSTYNTNGKQQINWMKLACDKAQLNLLPFFEKAGMLRPINAYIEDYGAGWNIITEDMITELKNYVKGKGYETPNEEINYINGHNYLTYKNKAKLVVPETETLGQGCESFVRTVTVDKGNGKTEIETYGTVVQVDHEVVKNAVAFEAYNDDNELVSITMFALGSDANHSYTQVIFPSEATYIKAVGYDGERKTIYSRSDIVWSLGDLSSHKCYTVSTARGSWYSDDTQLTSTGKKGATYNEEDVNQQFAFLKSDKGNYYLYSVAKEMFVQISEPVVEGTYVHTYTTLTESPKQTVVFESSTGAAKADYPWVVALAGKHVGISDGYTPGVITFYNDKGDGGNMVRIKAVREFDPADALAKIKEYEESAKYKELQALIAKHEEAVKEANTAVGSLTSAAATVITTAVAEAKKITDKNTDEEIQSAIETLNSAFENVEIVLPTEGKYYRMTNHTAANSVMYVAGDLGLSHKSGAIADGSDIFQFVPTTDGYYLYNVARGTYLSTAMGYGHGRNFSEATDVKDAKVLTVASFNDGTVPQVSLIPAGGTTMHADTNYGTVVGWPDVSNSKSAWYVSEVSAAEVKHTLTVSAARWSSLVLGFNATIPSGVTAYVVSSYVVPETIAGEATITPISGSVLPANTPVLINAAEGNYDFAYTTATATVGNNLLEGKPYNTYLTTVAGTTNYVLSYEGENVSTIGLYKKTVYDADRSDDVEGNDHITFFANKAYLPVTASNGAAPMLRITRGDDATGIQDAELTIDNGQLTIYDLTGRRVEKMEKGIYIVNGCKVIVK